MVFDGAHSEGVYEIFQVRDTNELHGCCEENQSLDSINKVLGFNVMATILSNKEK